MADNVSRESVAGDAVNLDGFVFSDKNAIEVAKKEKSAVDYLKEQVDFKRPEAVLSVYQKLVHQKVFHTVIGLSFLKELQDRLLAERQVPNSLVDPIDADPMIVKRGEEPQASGKNKKSVAPGQEKYREKFIAALVVCIILLITVAVMFVLALTSNSPTILNYRTQIENEYATWQQDLDRREKEVTQRENALLGGSGPQVDQSYDDGDLTEDGSYTYR